MHHPPEADYHFTIPSIHDDLPLVCSVYVPAHPPFAASGAPPWKKRGIIMASPYAPMGGTRDDRVVLMVVEEFINAGYIVGTFNFRGALGSKGRSSWSGRPELDDYTSCAAFFLQYMINIRPIPASGSNLTPEQPLVIIGGYSYGSLILRHLPPLANILQLLSCPSPGSAANEIQLRARKLADQSNLEWNSLTQRHERESTTRKSTEAKAPLMMGGEETSPEIRRSSRDKRRSLDGGFRAGLGNRLRSLSVRRCEDGAPSIGFHEDKASTTLTIPQIRYLLISPLTPPIATLIAPALGHRFWGFGREGSQETVGRHPTLVVYGDKDIFTSAKKTRTWSEQLEDVPESSLSSVEISGAGHFWVEPGMEEKLRATLKEWELEVR